MKTTTKKILKITLPILGVVVLASSVAAIVTTRNQAKIEHNKIDQKLNINKPKIGFSDYNYNFNVANTNNESIHLSMENIPDSDCISYFITSPQLKLQNFLIQSGTQTFKVPQALINYVNSIPQGYLTFELVAQYKSDNHILQTEPCKVTLYKNQPLLASNSVTRLFCVPSNSLTKEFDIGSKINIQLLSGLKDNSQVKQWEIIRLANNYDSSKYSVINDVQPTFNSENSLNEFSYIVLPGWQEIMIKAIGNDGKTLGVSNVIKLKGIQTMYMSLTNSNLQNELVELGDNTSTNLKFETNIPDFSLTKSNVYYQNANTSNQWVCLNTKLPSNFNIKINNNSLEITNMLSNFATNFKVVDPIHKLRSNIVTVSSYVVPSVYQPKIQVNGQTLINNQITLNEQSGIKITLTNTNTYKSSSLHQKWYLLNESGEWEEIGNSNSVEYTSHRIGTLKFKLSLTWTNLISSPSIDQIFNVNIKNNNSFEINNEKSILSKWAANTNNLKNVIANFLKRNENWTINYLNMVTNGIGVSFSSDNIKQILGKPELLVNPKNQQLVLKATIQSIPKSQQGTLSVKKSKFNVGNTLYVELPFYLKNNDNCSITTSVDESGYSYVNIKINPLNFMLNSQSLTWYVCNKNTTKVLYQNSFKKVYFAKSIETTISINHYDDPSIPQTIKNLIPLSNSN